MPVTQVLSETESTKRFRVTRILRILSAEESTGNVNESKRVKIPFSSEAEVDTVRKYDKCITMHLDGARLRGEQWYPIKVDRVYKFSIMNDSHSGIRPDAAKTISEDNSITVNHIRWLSKPESDRAYGSAV